MRRSLILFLLAIVPLAACARKMGDVVILNEVDPAAQATVKVMGETFFVGSGAELVAHVPARYDVRDATGVRSRGCVLPSCGRIINENEAVIHVVLETECGSSEWCVRFPGEQPPKGSTGPFHAEIKGRARPGLICLEEAYRIWVDNRGGPARVVTVGAVRREIPPGATSVVEMTAPACASMANVTLDGKVVGTLPVLADGLEFEAYDKNSRDFLIDPDARHCYDSTTFSYAPNPMMAIEPQGSRQVGSVFYALERPLDAFLQSVPDSIRGWGKRTQLVEIACPE